MKLLILGGTLFLGRHLAHEALQRGHTVTLFHRGKTNPHLFPTAQHILGDRAGDLSGLQDQSWDAVIDTSGYTPAAVAASAELLRPNAAHYTFISTISVYADVSTPDQNETAPLAQMPDQADHTITAATYGPLKVLCEQEIGRVFGDQALIIRPGLIIGPHDPTDRFTYWALRIAQGGTVLIPDDPTAPAQWIDARDLAAWTLNRVEHQTAGTFNATGPTQPERLQTLLDQCRAMLNRSTIFEPVAPAFLLDNNVQPFTELPFWLPHEAQGIMQINISRALAAGLSFRPLQESITDTHTWRTQTLADQPLQAGLSPDREAQLLNQWRKTQHTS